MGFTCFFFQLQWCMGFTWFMAGFVPGFFDFFFYNPSKQFFYDSQEVWYKSKGFDNETIIYSILPSLLHAFQLLAFLSFFFFFFLSCFNSPGVLLCFETEQPPLHFNWTPTSCCTCTCRVSFWWCSVIFRWVARCTGPEISSGSVLFSGSALSRLQLHLRFSSTGLGNDCVVGLRTSSSLSGMYSFLIMNMTMDEKGKYDLSVLGGGGTPPPPLSCMVIGGDGCLQVGISGGLFSISLYAEYSFIDHEAPYYVL